MTATAVFPRTQPWPPVTAVFSVLNRIMSFLSPPPQKQHQLSDFAPGPRDCILVLDASGSMLDQDWRPCRLAAAQEAAKAFCRRLEDEQPSARVGVVSYGDGAQVICQLTPASQFGTLAEQIDRIYVLGGTNMTEGLEWAHTLLDASTRPCQVVLLTDGHHNTGPKPWTIAETLRRFAIIECVGIGGSPKDVDEELLRHIASPYPDGTKRYRWIGDRDGLIQHFDNLAGGISRS